MCFNFHTEIAPCSDLTLITNGNITYNAGSLNDRPISTTATYMCNTGYTLTGSTTTRVCVTGGNWNGSTPTCQGEFCNSYTLRIQIGNFLCGIETGPTAIPPITCSDLNNLTNGMISYDDAGSTNNRPVNTVAIFSCDTGYTLNENATKTCGNDGIWSGLDPVCQRKWNGMLIFF